MFEIYWLRHSISSYFLFRPQRGGRALLDTLDIAVETVSSLYTTTTLMLVAEGAGVAILEGMLYRCIRMH